MSRARPTVVLLATLALFGANDQKQGGPTEYVEGEGYRGVILTSDHVPQAAYLSREKVTGFWTPTGSDIAVLEARLRDALEAAESNPGLLDPPSAEDAQRRAYVSGEIGKILEHLSEYRRQYLGIRLSQEQRIWVNFFPGEPSARPDPFVYWENRLVTVLDGGFQYWSIQFDPETMTFVEFYSHGYA